MPNDIRKKAEKVCTILINKYGKEVSERKIPPIDELVMTILSQHTNDINMYHAFESLKETYSSWDEVLAAPQNELAVSIRSSGMYNLKAKRIQASLREIKERVAGSMKKIEVYILSGFLGSGKTTLLKRNDGDT